jgi:hypothetical protein
MLSANWLAGRLRKPLSFQSLRKGEDMKSIAEKRQRIRDLSGEKFISSLVSLCSDLQFHHDVLMFGFIIYDETTPESRKTLRDSDYWEALDRSSGNRMMIFAMSDKTDSRIEGFQGIELLNSFHASRASKTKSYSHLMGEIFDDEYCLVYPSVLFFQVFEGNIYNYRLVPLRRGKVEESFLAVQELFSSINEVLTRITPENLSNYREIYELMRKELLRQEYAVYILNGPNKLADFIGRVKNLIFLL